MKVKGSLSSIVYSVSSHFFTSWDFSRSNLEGGKKVKVKERKKKGGSFVHMTLTARLIFESIASKENQKLKICYLKLYLGLQIFASLYV